jgi:hypothetical protein
VGRLLAEFQKEQSRSQLSQVEVLQTKAFPKDVITFLELFFEKVEIPFTLLSRSRTEAGMEAHYEVPRWVNLSFLARKITRKGLARIQTDLQLLKDESGESLTMHGQLNSGAVLIGLHKGHPKGRVCIVVDDMGHFGKGFPIYLSMNQPVAFSILPFYHTSPLQAKSSFKEGFEIMLHVPMEPSHQSYFKYPEIISRDLEEDELIARIKKVFDQVPFVSGWNNHQGSRATSDHRTMEIVMRELSKTHKNLYFIDSMTSPQTSAFSMARRYGIRSATRNFDFLDNKKDKKSIKHKISQLLRRSLRTSQPVVAILHETKVSASSLKEMLPDFKKHEIELLSPTDFLGNGPMGAI